MYTTLLLITCFLLGIVSGLLISLVIAACINLAEKDINE